MSAPPPPPTMIGRTNVVIPDEYVSAIIAEATEQSAVMRLCRRINMGTGATHMPVLAGLPTMAWVTPRDTGLKSTTFAEWDAVTLTAEEIAGIVPIPESVLDDATFDIEGEIRPLIAEAVALVIDETVLFGIGAPASFPTGGVAAHAVAAGNTVTRAAVEGQDLAEDINLVMAKVEEDGFDVNGFVARRGLKSSLRGLRDLNNAPLFAGALQAGQLDSLYGEPITYAGLGWADRTAELIAADWSKAVVGVRRDMTFKVLDQAVIQDSDGNIVLNLAQQDMVALRCVMRLGVALANPVTRAEAVDANRSPFAILAPVSAG